MKPSASFKKRRSTEERDLQAQADDLLAYDGWRKIVTDPPHLRGLGVSEKGIPDRLYIRYRFGSVDGAAEGWGQSDAQVLWIEWKAQKGNISVNQDRWLIAESGRGALVLIAGQDFPATLDGFKEWYRRSGLNRGKV